MANNIPPKFQAAIDRILRLQQHPQYQAAFLFGSAARGELTDQSDLDVIVIATPESGIEHVLHPEIENVKVDLSFNTFEQFRQKMKKQADNGDRIPMICESEILFDKTGQISALKQELADSKPPELDQETHKFQLFMVIHIDGKIKKALDSDQILAMFIMHNAISDLLKRHYKLQRRWRVADKRMLKDLHTWDPTLATMVEEYVLLSSPQEKYQKWQQMAMHVRGPKNQDLDFAETSCTCDICSTNLTILTKKS